MAYNTAFKLLPKKWNWQTLHDLITNSARPYKVYTALVTQTGTDAPTAIVLENTLGNITFTRTGVGVYHIVSDGLFTIDKTFFPRPQPDTVADDISVVFTSPSIIGFYGLADGITLSDDGLINNCPFEIRVYN